MTQTKDLKEIKEYTVKKKKKNTYVPRSKELLKELAKGCHRGEVFTSFQISEPDMVSTVFMPLMLMGPDMMQGVYQDRPYMFYSYMKDACPGGVNGYPMFWSMAYLNKADAEQFDAYYKQIQKAMNEI